MPQNSTSEVDLEDSDNDLEFVEVDSSGRYGRYKEVLGKGAFKKVYRAFDEWEGIEVAWNQVKVADLLRNSVDLERLYSEVHLLKTLKHKSIIKFYNSWMDPKHDHINFITEIFTSGTLRQYRKKHKHVDGRVLKKWSTQILEGLLYLHSHDPPVIHRDLKCDNIFVNGNQGEVKIGDLGLAAILCQARAAHSVIGTPEFMAPELYEEEYNELVDIYAFGMSLLELVTFEYPYVECANAAQIYKKVTAGIKPASLEKVKDPGVREFIEKCIAKVPERLSAKELLMDPFLLPDEDTVSRGLSLQSQPSNGDDNGKQFRGTLDDSIPEASRDFTVQGQRKDLTTIFLKLRISDSLGHIRNIHFPFNIEVDTSISVASEMVEELDLTDHDVSVISAMIDSEIRSHIPDWTPIEASSENIISEAVSEDCGSGALDDSSSMTNESGPLILERLPSGRKYWCDSPKASGANSPLRPVAESVNSGDSKSEENLPSPVIYRDVNTSHSPSVLGHMDYYREHDKCRDEAASSHNDLQNGDVVRLDDTSTSERFPSEETSLPSKNDSVDIKILVNKLEYLLDKQSRELVELKKKHALAVSDLLNDLPQEIHQKVLNIHHQKLSEHTLYQKITR